MKDLVNLIAEFVGEQTIWKKSLERLIFVLLEKSEIMKSDERQRKRTHMAQGILLAVRMLCFELDIHWGVESSFF